METESETEDEVSGSEPESDGSESDEEPETKQKMAAAGLCIGVGSFSDPKDVPGMAHFLEHMVFMGSKKFPKENDFDAFIKKSGGPIMHQLMPKRLCFISNVWKSFCTKHWINLHNSLSNR